MWTELPTYFIPTLGMAGAGNVAPGFPIEALFTHALAAGLASTWLVALSKAGEFVGNEKNVSQLPPERKLPHDSDAMVAGALFVIGAVVGLIIACALHFNQADVASYWPLSLIAGAVIGVVVPWPLVRRLGREYLERAQLNLEQGNYKEAMQDAAEVERISEVYKAQAREIKEYARQQRDQQLGGFDPQPVGATQSSESDSEFAEFLSAYTPGSL